jgi:hypothetical protein
VCKRLLICKLDLQPAKRFKRKEEARIVMALASLSRFMSLFGTLSQHRGLIMGLDAAGKTSVLYRLKLNELVQTIPTIGFNVVRGPGAALLTC